MEIFKETEKTLEIHSPELLETFGKMADILSSMDDDGKSEALMHLLPNLLEWVAHIDLTERRVYTLTQCARIFAETMAEIHLSFHKGSENDRERDFQSTKKLH